jgi:PAS domain S-box-containing protein
VLAQLRQCIAERREIQVTLLNYRKNGQPFWNELKIAPVFSDEGDLLTLLGFRLILPIANALKTSAIAFHTLPRSARYRGFRWLFQTLEPSLGKNLGYTNKELQSQPFLDFIHPEDQADTRAEVEKLATGVPTIYFENRYRCKNGWYKWLAWTAVSIVEEGLIYAIGRNITELKHSQKERLKLLEREQAARELAEAARNQSRNILESITDAFYAVDREWRFTYLNPQAERLLQRRHSQLVGKIYGMSFPKLWTRHFTASITERYQTTSASH